MSEPETASDAKRREIENYLGALSPGVQVVVLRELELAELRGHDSGPLFRNVMAQLRQSIRKAGLKHERVGNPSRLFFAPLAPYLADGTPPEAEPATVPRRCLAPLWAWLCRELMPEEAQQYIDICSKALLAEDSAAGLFAATLFQKQFIERAQKEDLARVARRLEGYGAPATALSDFGAVLMVLQSRERLADVGRQLPGSAIDKMPSLDGGEAGQARATLQRVEDDLLTYGIALMMSRLAVPWQVARAVRGDERLEPTAKYVVFGRVRTLMSHRDICAKENHADEADKVAGRLVDAANAIEAEFDLAPDEPGAKLCAFARRAGARPTGAARPPSAATPPDGPASKSAEPTGLRARLNAAHRPNTAPQPIPFGHPG